MTGVATTVEVSVATEVALEVRQNVTVKTCLVCGRLFLPEERNKTRFCTLSCAFDAGEVEPEGTQPPTPPAPPVPESPPVPGHPYAHKLVRVAQKLAQRLHWGQLYGGGPQFKHVKDVGSLLRRHFPEDLELQAAGYLHDAIEDAQDRGDARREIWTFCGRPVLTLVEAVTNEPGLTRSERWKTTLPKIAKAGERAIALKVADRVCNVRYSLGSAGDLTSPGHKFYKMYLGEYPEFRRALYATPTLPGLSALWATLDTLLGYTSPAPP